MRSLNKKRNPNPDYLINDFWACVAAGAVIDAGKLKWATIGDSQIAVFSQKGELKFVSPDGLKKFSNYVSKHPGYWRDPERRKFIRSQFRNNYNRSDSAGYGALTGEKSAEKFIVSGLYGLETSDLVVIFTDGFAKLLLKDGVFKYLKKLFSDKEIFLLYAQKFGENDYKNFGHERTLIVIET